MAFVAKIKSNVKETTSTLINIRVEVSRILFKDADSGYFVGLFETLKGAVLPQTAVKLNSGNTVIFSDTKFIGIGTSELMATSVLPEQEIELEGFFEEGREKDSIQMNIKNVIELMPTKPSSIRAFLKSSKMRGIGPKGADEAVKLWGPKTLKVLKESPREFLKIKGISEAQLEKLIASWAEWNSCYDCLSRLREFKISEGDSIRLYKHFGESADIEIKNNPYIATEVKGISFKTADQIAGNMGVQKNDKSRIKSGVHFLVQESLKNGSTYVNSLHLLEDGLSLLGVDKPPIVKALKDLMTENKIVQGKIEHRYLVNRYGNEYKDYILQGFADIKSFKAEYSVAKEVYRILESNNTHLPPFTQNEVDAYFDFNKDALDNSQVIAAKLILTKKVSFLTGGPGTGKTHTIKSLLNYFDTLNKNFGEDESKSFTYALCAPTGRAAKRMNEATGRLSSTIHSLLGYSPETGFQFDSQTPLPFDVLIVDESSMIDLWIASSLLKAVSNNSRIIFIGDGDQLKPVGPGKVFQDLMNYGEFAVARLLEIHRQAKDSQIILAAHDIIKNKMPKLFYEGSGKETDSIFIPASNSKEIHEVLINKVKDLLSKGVKPDDIQVLTPKKMGEIGVRNLNESLRPLLNKKYDLHSYLQTKFVSGDRVMQLKNRKDLKIYNGDVGVVKYYDEDQGSLTVIFDDKEVVLENKDMKQIDFCYASTIHKAQGSDYPYVIIPISPSDTAMWDCNLLYTAITRAKNFLYMIGDERTISISVASFKQVERLTGMKEALNNRFSNGKNLDIDMEEKFNGINELDLSEEMEDSVY